MLAVVRVDPFKFRRAQLRKIALGRYAWKAVIAHKDPPEMSPSLLVLVLRVEVQVLSCRRGLARTLKVARLVFPVGLPQH
jgi:hypothetical protein